jgi:hypothetical protein
VEDDAQPATFFRNKRLCFGIGAVVVAIVLVSLIIGCAVASNKSNVYFVDVFLSYVFIPIFVNQYFFNQWFFLSMLSNQFFNLSRGY